MRPRTARPGFDDWEFKYVESSPICEHCRQRIGFGRLACAAFPDFIPREIWNGEHDHTTPYPGDGGILFAPMTEADRERQRRYDEELRAWYERRRDELIASGRLPPRRPDEAPAEPLRREAVG